jgi:hypothetical protein
VEALLPVGPAQLLSDPLHPSFGLEKLGFSGRGEGRIMRE